MSLVSPYFLEHGVVILAANNDTISVILIATDCVLVSVCRLLVLCFILPYSAILLRINVVITYTAYTRHT